jgi:RNA polymerase sigma-70 factor (ECF subfamily)
MGQDLLHRIRAGDVSAFEELFRTLHAPLCEVVDTYVRSQAIAEEIVQDLFFVLWIKRSDLAARSLRAYLFSAARNRALHHLRHRAVVRRWALWIDSRPDIAGIAAPVTLPDRALEADERQAAVRAAIDALPPRTRLAIVLRWEHGMSNDAVAEAMGISIKGVEKLVATAKRKLRETLAPHGGALATLPD